MRFSTVAGNKGSADLRVTSALCVKLYTQEGNWESSGTISRVFIQDAIKFPDLVHAVKQDRIGLPTSQTP